MNIDEYVRDVRLIIYLYISLKYEGKKYNL